MRFTHIKNKPHNLLSFAYLRGCRGIFIQDCAQFSPLQRTIFQIVQEYQKKAPEIILSRAQIKKCL